MAKKLAKLKNILKKMRSVLVAFSGGVDSTFLLAVAKEVLKDRVLAVIAKSPTYPREEIILAAKTAKGLSVDFMTIKTAEFKDPNFISNPQDRCYYCKTELFSKLRQIADKKGLKQVIDGSNINDLSDYRPGAQAKKEWGIKSPLQAAGFTKKDIRNTSKKMGLSTWDKPAYACLASRIPYGTKIAPKILVRVGEGEKFLRSLGFKQLRVRHHGNIARIELEKDNLAKALDRKEEITRKFKRLGYIYTTLDLKGYRTGSMNEHLPHK